MWPWYLVFFPCMSFAGLCIKAVLTRNRAVFLNINTAVMTVLMWYCFNTIFVHHLGSMIFWPTMTSLPGNWWVSSSKFSGTSWGDRKTACRDVQSLQLHQTFFLLPVQLQRVMIEITWLEMHLMLCLRSQGSTGRKFLLFLVMLINICVLPARTLSAEIGVCPFAIRSLMRPTAPHCETLVEPSNTFWGDVKTPKN